MRRAQSVSLNPLVGLLSLLVYSFSTRGSSSFVEWRNELGSPHPVSPDPPSREAAAGAFSEVAGAGSLVPQGVNRSRVTCA